MVKGCLAREEGNERSLRVRGKSSKHAACFAGDAGDKMTDEDREWARRAAAGLPPLTEGQRDILALLLSRRR